MNIIITAQVTYEISDVANFEEAVGVFQQCVTSEARHMEGVSYTGTRELFATEMTEEHGFDPCPKTWEMEEV